MAQSSIFHLIYTNARGLIFILPFALHLLLADIALSLLLPVSFYLPNEAYSACSALADSVWSHIQSIFEVTNSARIVISGDPLPGSESAVVVANHNAWADFYMIQALAQRAGMLGYCRWFAKAQLKNVPLLGWGLWAMGMPMVTRNWTSDVREMERVFEGPVKRGRPVWLVSFSEATRFTERKYEAGVRWCKENDRPVMRHVLYPRFKGFVATVGELRKASQVKAVYDFTIAYAERAGGKSGKEQWRFMAAPDIWATLSRPDLNERYCFWVNVRRFELDQLPHDAKELEKWLETRWVEKGELLEQLNVGIRSGVPIGKLCL